MTSRLQPEIRCAWTLRMTVAIPRASLRAGMITETRRKPKSFRSGSTRKGMLMHVLVKVAERVDELGPPEMFLGVSATCTGQPVRAFRITQEADDSSCEIGNLRCNEHSPIFIQYRAMGRDIGGDDGAPRCQVVEHLEWQVAAI